MTTTNVDKLLNTFPELYREVIAKGLERLNSVARSGWFWHVDVDILDMSRNDNCILGQLYSTYPCGIETIFEPGENPCEFGFSVKYIPCEHIYITYPYLTYFWKKIIRTLRLDNME